MTSIHYTGGDAGQGLSISLPNAKFVLQFCSENTFFTRGGGSVGHVWLEYMKLPDAESRHWAECQITLTVAFQGLIRLRTFHVAFHLRTFLDGNMWGIEQGSLHMQKQHVL